MLLDATKTTAFLFDEQFIKAQYFFSTASALPRQGKSHKILLEISFNPPGKNEKVDLRVVKSVLILCQPKEVIEAVVQREIREFLQLFSSVDTNLKQEEALSLSMAK
jgi:hypothetical protein